MDLDEQTRYCIAMSCISKTKVCHNRSTCLSLTRFLFQPRQVISEATVAIKSTWYVLQKSPGVIKVVPQYSPESCN